MITYMNDAVNPEIVFIIAILFVLPMVVVLAMAIGKTIHDLFVNDNDCYESIQEVEDDDKRVEQNIS